MISICDALTQFNNGSKQRAGGQKDSLTQGMRAIKRFERKKLLLKSNAAITEYKEKKYQANNRYQGHFQIK